ESFFFFFFFFSSRRRHTRFDCDWSSDVCSSDLTTPWFAKPNPMQTAKMTAPANHGVVESRITTPIGINTVAMTASHVWERPPPKIGRASCRERVEITGVGG